MNGAIKLLSRIFKILKILENHQLKFIFKNFKEKIRIFKKRNICERTLSGVYGYKISSRCLEK